MKGGHMNNAIITQPLDTKLLLTVIFMHLKINTSIEYAILFKHMM